MSVTNKLSFRIWSSIKPILLCSLQLWQIESIQSLCARANLFEIPYLEESKWLCRCHSSNIHACTMCIWKSTHVVRWCCSIYSDVLHPNRANVSKDELRQKLAELYKANKDQVSCFGFRTQYGGGKSTGFALIYDSHEIMKKFEPHYRLVRYGAATKVEKASRQQRMYHLTEWHDFIIAKNEVTDKILHLVGKQRKNRAKTVRGTAKTKAATKEKKK